jgi:CHAT domain-containing protein
MAVSQAAVKGPGAHARLTRRTGLAMVCVGVALACGGTEPAGPRQGELAGLAADAAISADAPRLSVWPARPPCATTPGPASAFRQECAESHFAGDRAGHLAAVVARATQRVREHEDPEAMHTLALVDLLFASSVERPLARSISAMRAAARMARRPAPILADLAAAHLVRAERAGAPRDLLAAIEAAEEALELEPRNPDGLYNRALALQRFGLVEEAAGAWREYLAVDPGSAWSARARTRLAAAAAMSEPPPPPPGPNAPVPAFTAYANAEPQVGRLHGFCRVLGAWAQADLAGDTAHARAQLIRAEALAAALERRHGGDASLADAVRAVQGATGAARASLAAAHRDFAEGCALDDRVAFGEAADRFGAAARGAGASPVFQAWARLRYGSMVFHRGDSRTGEAIFRELAATSDTSRHPALAGHASVLLAARLIRGDRHEEGLVQALRGARLLAWAGERENEGAALDTGGIAQFTLRNTDQGYALTHRALQRLLPYRTSYRLHNLLSYHAEIVSGDGFPRAAVRVLDEGVRVAERTRNPVYVVEARLGRARVLLATGDPQRAGRDVAVARPRLDSLPDAEARGWMTALLQMLDATASARSRPAQAAVALDSAATFFLGIDAPLVALPAVVDGAWAWLAAGDTARGVAGLEEALGLLERRRDAARMELRRAAVFEAARTLVDRVVLLKLGGGDTTQALAYLDRGRASLAPAGTAPRTRDVEVKGPPGEVVLEYGLVGDTLLAWTVAERRVELFRAAVDTAQLFGAVENLRRRLEDGAGEAELRPGLSRLYEWLIRPVAERLGAPETPLVVVADGVIAAVPFAALFDAGRGRYLVEDHPLRFAPSLVEARRPARGGRAGTALFVADPAFDELAHPGFERLGAAAHEAVEIAGRYPARRVLEGAAADGRTLREALSRAEMLHYAGHAVFDDDRPERSYLLLARTPGHPAMETLQAGEIAQLDLRHLSVVVLAACQTVRTGPGRAAGFSGLSGAFLAAGAGGTVGSLWEVGDRNTRPLMLQFHGAYRRSGNGPAALRDAQRHLLQSRDPALRSPSTWAAFRYTGR